MKKLLLLIITFNINLLLSQTFEPSQHKFIFKGDTIKLSSDLDYFKQDKFLLGWHWGGGKKISKSLDMNQNDADPELNPSTVVDSCLAFFHTLYGSHAVGNEIMNGKGFQYEPTLFS